MKITSVDVIKNGERDLMDAITADLDWGAVEQIFKERHNLSIEEDIEYRKGDIVVHDENVAYRLDFVAKVTLSVLLDRDGNYLSIDIAGGTVEKDLNAGTEGGASAKDLDAGDDGGGSAKDLDAGDEGEGSAKDMQGYERVLSEVSAEDEGTVKVE